MKTSSVCVAACFLVALFTTDAHATFINGGFEEGGIVGSLDGWTASGLVEAVQGLGGAGGLIEAHTGWTFALFNIGGRGGAGNPLTQNVLSQDILADQLGFTFFWNRSQVDYLGEGGVTFRVAYNDLSVSGPMVFQEIDFAPDGSTPDNVVHPWHEATIAGLVLGHLYHFEFQGGFDSTSATGHLYYTLDDVGGVPVPEPSTLLLLASGLAGLGGIGWRRRHRA